MLTIDQGALGYARHNRLSFTTWHPAVMGPETYRMGAKCHQQKELGLSSAGFSC
jgi:hypothetical protein